MEFNCPICGKHYQAGDEMTGKAVNCKSCGQTFRVPAGPSDAAATGINTTNDGDDRFLVGEMLRLDTGCLMAMGPTVSYDIQFVGGLKNAFFGGEGLFLATVRGPGPVWLQSLPFSRFAGRLASAIPSGGNTRKGEGSLLGGLGEMFMGD